MHQGDSSHPRRDARLDPLHKHCNTSQCRDPFFQQCCIVLPRLDLLLKLALLSLEHFSHNGDVDL